MSDDWRYSARPSDTPPVAPVIVKCPGCGQLNRMPATSDVKIRCSVCKHWLSPIVDFEYSNSPAAPRGNQSGWRRRRWLGGVAAFFLLAYFVAAPYITVYRMKSAAEKHDGEALSEFIDFPGIRQGLKDQANASISTDAATDNPFGALGSALAGTLIDHMVDAYVTPAGVTRLMAGEKFKPDNKDSGTGGRDPFSGVSMEYESFDKFAVTVKDDDGADMKFVLRRRGINWKLTDIHLPPGASRTRSTDAMPQFGGTGPSQSSSPTRTTPKPAPAPPPASPVGVGNSAIDGAFAFTVESSDEDDVVNFDETDAVYPQGAFVLVTIQVKNIGRSAQTYSADYQRLVDAEGREFSPDRRAMWTGAYIKQTRVDINPGNSTSVGLVFDVPKGTKPNQYVLSLRDSLESPGVELSIPPVTPPSTFAPTASDDQRFLGKLAADLGRYPTSYPPIWHTNPALAVNVAHDACQSIHQTRHMTADDFGHLSDSLAQRWGVDKMMVGSIVNNALESYPNCS